MFPVKHDATGRAPVSPRGALTGHRFARRAMAALGPLLLAGVAMPGLAQAESSAVTTLIKQADYWRSKGREDLAQQALRRAKALDPNSAAVQSRLARPAPKPAPAPTPDRTPSPAPARAASPSQPSSSVRAGQARTAGYDALQDSNLASASAQFEKALAVNRRDPDAMGGLGLVRLRQQQFAEAADLLEQASRLGKADQWASALASARFFAGLDEARDLLAQGRLADAQTRAEALVRSGYSDSSPALELLAQIYEKQGRYADSADLYRQAAEGGKADEKRLQLRAVRSRALAAAQAGDDLGAQREFQQGLVIDPSDPWIRYEFARFMIKRGRVPEAESLLRSLASTGQPDSLYAAALIDNELGRSEDAARLIGMIPEAQRTAPMRNLAMGVKVDAAIERARAMAKTGGQMQALAALRQIGATASLPVGKRVAVASAMLELGDAMGAVSLAQSAMNQDITNIEDYEGLVDVFARAGRDDLARTALQRAETLAGGSAEGQQAYARMSAKLAISQAERARQAGRFADAFDMLQTAWNGAPNDPDVLGALARLYQAGRMPGRAAQTYQLLLASKPDDRDALLGLAESAQAAGDKALSERAEKQVLDANPADYEAYMRMARVEQARGDDGDALKLFKQAREIYARRTGTGGLTGGNPFAAVGPGEGNNPFRNMPAAPVQQPRQVNPFALDGGTRLDGGPAAPYGAATGYAPATYGQSAGSVGAPTASFAPAGYGQSAYPGAAAAPAYAASGTGGYTAGAGYTDGAGQADATYPADPVMAQLESDIQGLARDNAPRVEVGTAFRQRSGEAGLSQLDEIKGSAKISAGALGGRFYGKGEAVVVDAGRPTGSGLARFGRNATPEAQGIVDEEESALVNADSQNASGVALSAGYESDIVQLEAGTTSIGMGKTKATFNAAVTPKFSNTIAGKAWVARQPVTDSVLSYAGTRDPVTGERWGQVMRTGGGLSLSYDQDGSGVYGEGRYYRFRGTNVVRNDGFEANVGGYLQVMRGPRSTLKVGLNVNYQKYDKSQNTFTFGNGGYFSPQSFLSIGFPVNYTLDTDRLTVRANLTPGFQSYSEDESAIYPTDSAAQAQLDALKALNSDVRSYYDSTSKTGFALNAGGSVYYRVGANTQIGGEASYNTFGSYDELRSVLGVRQTFGSTK